MLVFREIKQHFDGEYNKIETLPSTKFLHSLRFRGRGIDFLLFLKHHVPIDLENPCQLPVLQVLEGTDDCVLSILGNFFTLYVFKVKESISAVFQSYYIRMTLKFQVNFRFPRYSRVLMIGLTVFRNFFILTFLGSRNLFLDVSRSYHVRVTPKI